MVLRDFSYNKHARQMVRYGVCQMVFWLSWGPPMVIDGASMVPAGRYAFPKNRKGLVSVKNRIIR